MADVTIALYPASFDLPTLHEVRRREDDQSPEFGREVALNEAPEQQLAFYEADLLLIEAHVTKELARARRRLEDERLRRLGASLLPGLVA